MPDPDEKPEKILSLGEMDRGVAHALTKRFEVCSAEYLGLEAAIASVGPEVRAIVTRGRDRIGAELMGRLPRLELIANFGVGYDSIDVLAARQRGVMVTNTPNVLNDEMADFAVGLLLATVRRFPQADQHVRSGRWSRGETFPLSASLRGRTIGIAGMGRIGTVIARRLQGFDLPIAYFARHPRPTLPYMFHDDLHSLARAVDTLIVVLPGGPETRGIIDADILRALGCEGILINVARGSVVDEKALIEALRSGTILAAGLDVFEHEPDVPTTLLEMDQVVLLPHIGTATHHTRERMGDLLVRNVLSWFDGLGPITPVQETAPEG